MALVHKDKYKKDLIMLEHYVYTLKMDRKSSTFAASYY